MHPIHAGRRGLIAALCAAVLSGAAFAADTARDETTLLVRTSAGAMERLQYEGELADGERRALTTVGGNPATLSRNGGEMLLELAGERFEVKVPDVALAGVELDDLAGDAAGDGGKRHIVIHRHEDSRTEAPANGEARHETRKVVKVIRRGDGAAAADGTGPEVLALALDDAAPEVLMMDGEGPKVVVLRRIVRHEGSAP